MTSAINGPLETSPNAMSSPGDKHPDALPLTPKITPALAVAGVFLILTGLLYTFIGIKNRWVQIFLSSAYLTSLSVTVLLVYVMNPPVGPAIQGAYLVAAFMTGVIFGVGALVFKEVTEGLGCLLGGFCLSMWLLALRSGGTLRSTGDKAIFITVFTVAVYALSFNRRTRPYGLIGATSFAGATAAVLGFDCFTRAGLKEFWLYIWSLNDKLFPINTNTYPITRGIKVELAVTVLICFLGVMSQLKLWIVIKDRRQKKDDMHLGNERERNQTEEAIGRRLEEGNERERAQWELIYGDNEDSKRSSHMDSGLGTEEKNSLRKTSMSIKEVVQGGSCNEEAKPEPEKIATTIKPITEDAPASEPELLNEKPMNSSLGLTSGKDASNMPPLNSTASRMFATETSESPAPSPALPTPLPFTIPSAAEPEKFGDGIMPNAAEVERNSRVDSESLSCKQADANSVTSSDNAIVNPYAPHSKTSSVAATINDDWEEPVILATDQKDPVPTGTKDLLETSTPPEAVIATDFQHLGPEDDVRPGQLAKASPAHACLSTGEDSDPEEFQRPLEGDPKPKVGQYASSSNYDNNGVETTTRSSRSRPTVPESQTEDSQVQDFGHKSSKRLSQGAASTTGSLTKGVLDRVPSQLSHVVMKYRTNEWAKHIYTANEPEFDEPEVIPEGAKEDFPMHLIERCEPPEVEEFQQTAVVTPQPETREPTSAMPSPPPTVLNRTFSGKSSTSNTQVPSVRFSSDIMARPDMLGVLSPQQEQGNASAIDVSRSATGISQPPLLATRNFRSISTPVLDQTLVNSPIDENAEAEFRPSVRPTISPLQSAGSTLLAQRDSFLRTKHHQLPTRNAASPTEMMYSQPPIRSTSRLSLIEEAGLRSASRLSNFEDDDPNLPIRSANRLSLLSVDDENMPLSRRKAIIQQQAVTSVPETRLATIDNFDAHLPKRSSSAMSVQKRDSMFASWRESMRQEVSLGLVPDETVDTRRADMLMEKRQSRMSQQYSEATKINQETAFEQAMRRGDMQELHKEAMRKMQANANRHV
jgi:Domain of unknown function (DUF4203)